MRRDFAYIVADQIDRSEQLCQQHSAAAEHVAGCDRGLTPVALALVQSVGFDMVSLVMLASRTMEAVLAPANLFEQSSAGWLSGEFPGPFEITNFDLFHVNVYFIISMIYVMMFYSIQYRNSDLNAEAY